MIVAVEVTSDTNDLHQLIPALERIQQSGLTAPRTIIADNGYAPRHNVEQTAERHVELIAPWKDEASRHAGLSGDRAKETSWRRTAAGGSTVGEQGDARLSGTHEAPCRQETVQAAF